MADPIADRAAIVAMRTSIARKLPDLDARDLEVLGGVADALRLRAMMRRHAASGVLTSPELAAITMLALPEDVDALVETAAAVETSPRDEEFELDGVPFTKRVVDGAALQSGRSLYAVWCRACALFVHDATTSAEAQAEYHVDRAHGRRAA